MSRSQWSKIEALFKEREVKTVNTKITIIDEDQHEHDLYVKLGWADGRWVWFDVTVSRYISTDKSSESPTLTELRRKLVETNRRMLELICIHATELMQSDERTIDDIVELWKGTQFEPRGTCEAIRTPQNFGRVTSPLDAAAKLVLARNEEWTARMKAEEGRG